MRFNSTSSRRARRVAVVVGEERRDKTPMGVGTRLESARSATWATNRVGLRPRRWPTGRPPPQPRPRSPSRSVSTTRPRRRRRALGRPCPPPPTRRHPRRPTPRRPTPRSPNAWTVSRSRTTSRRPPPRSRPRPPTPTPRLTRRPGARPPAASATTSRVNPRATARKRAVAVAVAEGVHLVAATTRPPMRTSTRTRTPTTATSRWSPAAPPSDTTRISRARVPTCRGRTPSRGSPTSSPRCASRGITPRFSPPPSECSRSGAPRSRNPCGFAS